MLRRLGYSVRSGSDIIASLGRCAFRVPNALCVFPLLQSEFSSSLLRVEQKRCLLLPAGLGARSSIGILSEGCKSIRPPIYLDSGASSRTQKMALRAVRNRQKAAAASPYVRPAAVAVPKQTSDASSKNTDTAAFPLQRKFGQHLLKNPGILDKLIAAANITSSDVVLEIGPG